MSKTNKTITYSDNVLFNSTDGSSNKVYVIKDKSGKAVWQKGKYIDVSKGSNVAVLANVTQIDGTKTSKGVIGSFIVRAGESVTFSASVDPLSGYVLTGASSTTKSLASLSTLTDSSFNSESISFPSKDGRTYYTVTWSLGDGVSVDSQPRSILSGGSFSFTATTASGYRFALAATIDGTATITRTDNQTSNMLQSYKISDIKSNLTINIPAISISGAIGIKDILDPKDGLFEKFDPDVVKVDLSRSDWIIEPIEPIQDNLVTFRVSPQPIGTWGSGETMYAALPSGIKLNLINSTGISCSYRLEQKSTDDVVCGYITFSGTLKAEDTAAAKLVFNTAPRITLHNITSSSGEYTYTSAIVSGDYARQQGNYSIETVDGIYRADMGIAYDLENGVSESGDQLNYTSNQSSVCVGAPDNSFWALTNPNSTWLQDNGLQGLSYGWVGANGVAQALGFGNPGYTEENIEDWYTSPYTEDFDFTGVGILGDGIKLCSLDSQEVVERTCKISSEMDTNVPIHMALVSEAWIENTDSFSNLPLQDLRLNYIQLSDLNAARSGNYHLVDESSKSVCILIYVTQEDLQQAGKNDDVDQFFFPNRNARDQGDVSELEFMGDSVNIPDNVLIIDKAAGNSNNADWSGFVFRAAKSDSNSIGELIITKIPTRI